MADSRRLLWIDQFKYPATIPAVVVDYRSQTEETELEYAVLEYEQETLQFF